MGICAQCQTNNPDSANYCMACGDELKLVEAESKQTYKKGVNVAGLNLFMLSLLGSIALSLVLIFIFRLPVFFLAAFLPLLWAGRNKDKP